jgi:urea carboxylase
VGIGGAYMCIYGMEGPGGYQLFGRTLQVWNTFKSTQDFQPGKPWLLRHFDQIRFYPVDAAELMAMRDAFPHGGVHIRIEAGEFRYRDYQVFLASIQDEADLARSRQQEAFADERARWSATGQTTYEPPAETGGGQSFESDVPDGCQLVSAPLSSNVWKVLVEPGQAVTAGQGLVVLEAMKTETIVASPAAGIVEELRTGPDTLVMQGQPLLVLRPARENG